MNIISPGGEILLGSQHELHGGPGERQGFVCQNIHHHLPQAVVYVHHGQPGVGPQVALVDPRGQGIVEYLHCVVSGSSSRVRIIGDDSWEPWNQGYNYQYF